MSDFRKLSDRVWVSPQLTKRDIAAAAKLGIGLIVNNRPDGEEAGQPAGFEIERMARSAGMDFIAIPVTMATMSDSQVALMAEALTHADGPVLAYCRSGTRSTLLWAMAQAKLGQNPDDIAEAAQAAGYDVGPVRMALEAYASKAE
jgi:uncharacterized protein (TIGR01244 family)